MMEGRQPAAALMDFFEVRLRRLISGLLDLLPDLQLRLESRKISELRGVCCLFARDFEGKISGL